MASSKIGRLVEWSVGRLEVGRLFYDFNDVNVGWSLQYCSDLHWYRADGLNYNIGTMVGASTSLFEGREAVMSLRQFCLGDGASKLVKGECFAEFPTHYVTNWVGFRTGFDHSDHPFNPSMPILCPTLDFKLHRVTTIQRPRPAWVGARYRLRTEPLPIDPGWAWDPARDLPPVPQAELRRIIDANQKIRDGFIADPLGKLSDAICEEVIFENGKTVRWVEGCTFTGLLPTPSDSESVRLMGLLNRPQP